MIETVGELFLRKCTVYKKSWFRAVIKKKITPFGWGSVMARYRFNEPDWLVCWNRLKYYKVLTLRESYLFCK